MVTVSTKTTKMLVTLDSKILQKLFVVVVVAFCSVTFRMLSAGSGKVVEDADREQKKTGNQSTDRSLDSVNGRKPFLGFIRIQKTASTSVCAFLATASGLETLDRFLIGYDGSNMDVYQRDVQYCVYHNPEESSLEPPARRPRQWYNECAHLPLPSMKNYWESFRPYLPSTSGEPNLQWFTVIRDPFDRMVSYYHHTLKLCNTDSSWLRGFTGMQLELLCAGDMEGWFRELYKEGGGLVYGLPLQYQYIDEDIDEAIARIEGDSPHVYVLLQECFEESLRFMEMKFLLRPGATNTFLQSSLYHTRNNQARYHDEADVALLRKLRKAFEEWWPDDFRFYNAAVLQFQRQLLSIQFDSSLVRGSTCPYLLGSKESELR
jgi:hypothetical protein